MSYDEPEDDDWDPDFDECPCCVGPCDCYNEGRYAPEDPYEPDDNTLPLAHDDEDFGDDDIGNKAFANWMTKDPEEVEKNHRL